MAPFNPKRKSISAPKMGGGSNLMEQFILAQAKGSMQAKQKKDSRADTATEIDSIKSSLGERLIPGSTYSNEGLSVPLVNKLTQDERADIDHYNVIEGYINNMEQMMDKDPDKFQTTFLKAITPGSIGTLGDEDAVTLSKDLQDWRDRILRARSKSQTTEKEFSRIKGFSTPSFKDITVTSSVDPEDPNKVISYPTIRRQFKNVRDSIQRGKDLILKGSLAGEYGSEQAPQQQSMNPTQPSQQPIDPVEAIKQRFKQRNP